MTDEQKQGRAEMKKAYAALDRARRAMFTAILILIHGAACAHVQHRRHAKPLAPMCSPTGELVVVDSSLGPAYEEMTRRAIAWWNVTLGRRALVYAGTTDPGSIKAVGTVLVAVARADHQRLIAMDSASLWGLTESMLDRGMGCRTGSVIWSRAVGEDWQLADCETSGETTVCAYSGHTRPATPAQLYRTLVHEFGHALALRHSTEPGTLMYTPRTLQDLRFVLGSDTLADIARLYGGTQ